MNDQMMETLRKIVVYTYKDISFKYEDLTILEKEMMNEEEFDKVVRWALHLDKDAVVQIPEKLNLDRIQQIERSYSGVDAGPSAPIIKELVQEIYRLRGVLKFIKSVVDK